MKKNAYKAFSNGNRSQTWCIRDVATGEKVRDHLLNRAEATYEALLLNVKAKQAAVGISRVASEG